MYFLEGSLLLESPLTTSHQGDHSVLQGLSTIHIWATLETGSTPFITVSKVMFHHS